MARRNTRAASKRPAGPGLGAKLTAAVLAAVAAMLPSRATMARAAGALWRSRTARRVAGVAGACGLCGVLAWVMLHQLRQDGRYRIEPSRIELAAEPTWASPELAAQVRADIESDLRRRLSDMPASDAFDSELPALLAARLEESPWVAKVVRVDRRFPDSGEAHARLLPVLAVRRPALIVEGSDRCWLLDADSVVLPLPVPRAEAELRAFQGRLTRPLRVVRGVAGSAPEAGRRWESEQVLAALSMENILRQADLDRALPIDAIELVGVPDRADARGRVHYQADGCVILVPDQTLLPGTRLIWGRPPVHASTLELSPNDKLAKLKDHMLKPESMAGARIDLRKA